MSSKTKRITSAVLSLLILMSVFFSTPVLASEVKTTPAQAIVDIALGEVGNGEYSTAYTKYNKWYGVYCAWCCIFVSWCANEMDLRAGTNAYGNIFPKTATCQDSLNWYKSRGLYHTRSSGYVPKTGDLIYFDWSGTSSRAGHIGIVVSVSGNTVNQVSGNFGHKVAPYSYKMSDTDIMGYASPNYSQVGDEILLSGTASTTPPNVDASMDDYIATGVTTDNLNMRTGPSTSYSKISVLSENTTVNIVGKFSTGWYKIKYSDSAYGYVSSSYVNITSTSNTTTTAASTTVAPTTTTTTVATTENNLEAVYGLTTENLNLRTGSSTSYDIQTVIPKGSKLEVLEKLSNGWYKVNYGNYTGFVSGTYVEISENETTTTTPTTTTTTVPTTITTTLAPTTTTTTVPTTVTTTLAPTTTTTTTQPTTEKVEEAIYGLTMANLNLRTGPSISYSVMTVIPNNSTVEVVDMYSHGWYKVKYGSRLGFVSCNYINLYKAPVTTTTTTTVPTTVTTTKAPTTTVPTTILTTVATTLAPTTTTTTTKVTTTEKVDETVFGLTTENLNLRTGSSTSYSIQTVIPKSTKIEVLEQLSNGWYKVKHGTYTGFVSGTYVEISKSETPTTTTTTVTTTEKVDETVYALTTANLNLRTGPSTSYRVITVLSNSTKVEVLEKLSSGWCQVKCGNNIGYVSSTYLNF